MLPRVGGCSPTLLLLWLMGRAFQASAPVLTQFLQWNEGDLREIKSILENLMEAVSQNLAHRHQYVRRNAMMCLYNIYQSTGIELIEDFIPEIEKICTNESDLSTKRNAFILLFHVDQQKALTYLK